MSTVGDGLPAEVALITSAESTRERALGRRLESFRAYLLTIARREMSAELRTKCGASDVVQQAFCEAVRDREAMRGRTPHQVRGWLRCILTNTIRDMARSYGQAKRNMALEVSIAGQDSHELIDPELTPSSQAIAREEADSIDTALARLPEDYRRVIELRNRDCRPFGEIGALLGRSADAARMLWFRAIEKLQEELASIDAA